MSQVTNRRDRAGHHRRASFAENLYYLGSTDAGRSRQDRYAQIAANLQVKEVKLDDAGDRFIICFNPDEAERDKHVREQLVDRLTDKITGSDELSTTKRAELRGQISTSPGLNRFLRVTPGGLLRVDAAAAKAEARLDGKYLLRCSDPKLTPKTSPWATSSSWKSNAAGAT